MIHLTKKTIYFICLTTIVFANQVNNDKFIFYKAFSTCEDSTVKIDIYPYTDEEANKIYKDKIINIGDYQCKVVNRIFENEDKEYNEYFKSYYYVNRNLLEVSDPKVRAILQTRQDSYEKEKLKGKHFYSNCVYNNLDFKIYNQKFCISTNNKDIFGEMFLLNEKYLINVFDGFFFLFKKQETNQSKLPKDLNKPQSKNTPIETEKEKSFFSKVLEWFGFSKLNHNMSFMYS